MDELPEEVDLPISKIAKPRPSAAAVISRYFEDDLEILLCHRVSEVPSFPDFWAFPGGGISRVDKAAAESNSSWFSEREDRESMIALLREMVEEVGIAPDGNGGFLNVPVEVMDKVNESKSEWLNLVTEGKLVIDNFDPIFITERTTPPVAPIRHQNRFYHIATGENGVIAKLPTGRSEFDDFQWWKPKKLLDAWLSHRVKLPPPQVTLIRDIVRVGFDELSKDPPSGYHRIEYANGVELVPIPTVTLPPATHTDCYVLGHPGGSRILVDPAAKSKEALDILRKKVVEIEDSGSKIISTIFTHKHPDHIGDLAEICKIYQAPIFASKETLAVIPKCETDRVLREGDVVEIDDETWAIIETPGHCPGHICLVGDAGIVSGDNAVLFGTILVPSSDGDMNEYLRGLERLRDLDPSLLFPGHGPMVANPKRLLKHYLKHRKTRHSRVLNAVRSGHYDLNSITNEAYADTPDAHLGLAKDQTISHLKALISSGDVVNRSGRFEYIEKT
jgi:glyoxylase-like metal-dependent hydrolase (beta-lactamase superfamily II)/8-oxo-dGTP pyrophosphatase MutT (NUDIX family)